MPRLITPDEIRPLIGNLSRSNYYEMRFGGLPLELTSYLTTRGVNVPFITNDMGLLCDNAQLPGMGIADTQSYDFTGVTQNFAHAQIFTPINLSFYVDDEYRTLKFLNHWMEYIFSGNGTGTNFYANNAYNYRLKYPKSYKADSCKIFKFEKDFERILEYSFIGLFPKNLSSSQVRYGPNNELTRVNCSFTYDRYIPGSIYSFDFVRGQGNDLLSTLNDITNFAQDGLSLLNRFLNR